MDDIFDTARELSEIANALQERCNILDQQVAVEEEASYLADRQIRWMRDFLKEYDLLDTYMDWINSEHKNVKAKVL